MSTPSRGARPSAVVRVHHLLLEVRDLDASEAFYTQVLGFAVRKREEFRDGRRLIVTEQGLGLTEGGSGSKGVLQHLCFSARGIDGIAAHAAAAGCEIVRGPGPGPYGHTVYIRDPDGYEIELFDDPADTEEASHR
ncbi:VOC family protein [Nocardioides caldifontis]|uniref:VOC family protein n=1 Tax=Nocardioides caldifontis TaxID=2588938 RepID=UPI0011E03D4B|nr:VOC family protein [Nocardioides caldifontis]